jgi:hypothetical protein
MTDQVVQKQNQFSSNFIHHGIKQGLWENISSSHSTTGFELAQS